MILNVYNNKLINKRVPVYFLVNEGIIFTRYEIELSMGVSVLCIDYQQYDLVKNGKIGKIVNKIGTKKSFE